MTDMVTWRPIETAPKDGTWVMVHYHEHCVPLITFYIGDEKRWSNDLEFGRNKPTHWMPLPKPPADILRGEEGEKA